MAFNSWRASTVGALLVSSGAILATAGHVAAQGRIIGTEAVDDQIRDIERQTADEFDDANDAARFGFGAFPPGFSGSLSASGTFTDGNTESTDFALGGRIRYGAGLNNVSLGVVYFFGENDDETNENNLYLTLDYNRYITDQFYVFALGLYEYDEFASIEHDAFLGFGPGYRIINRPDLAWRVQAGPGIRYIKELESKDEETEVAGIASSRFFYQVNENVFFTNDTDILFSDVNTNVINDAGVNFKVTDALATRLSLVTDYNSDPAPGFEHTDNKVQFSVVYGFN